ncbi:oligopeptide/dipeptide ABC transporter ATP-binding protein [Rhodoligotrophos defluvii]|uniref:oligopeptide/dipeptide ABC transporter ATP-binding protein n=1 Tax=Rhodoligotrophos defluvii TaxID=2561934 RepID=UPI0010C9A9CB|nr:oligopeptide/dipeptide ABC transporter ATP-binding protein [Rhodoligotrophos defluvii]
MADRPLLEVRNLTLIYGGRSWFGLKPRRPAVWAADDVSFQVARGRTFALVGESGSGKSTIARAVAGLLTPNAGSILFEGGDVTGSVRARPKEVKRRLQIVFQNPDASLNPRHSVRYLLGRPIAMYARLAGVERDARVRELLASVQLDPGYVNRRSRELSGGEGQRVAIARALAAEPSLIICDEILSALDVSVQAGVIDLLRQLQRDRDLAYLFISHDLAVVRWLAHDVGVLYRGRFCEVGRVEAVFRPPYHPYTEMLLAAVPRIGRPIAEAATQVSAPAPSSRAGCVFAHRCPRKLGSICDTQQPPARTGPAGKVVHCHIPLAELAKAQADLVDIPASASRTPLRSSA